MFENLLREFTGSQHYSDAITALGNQGIDQDQATDLIDKALPAAAEAMTAQTKDHPQPEIGLFNVFGGHAGKELLIGLTEGILRGDGVAGSIEDAGISLIAGHVGEVIGEKTGLPEETCGLVAATVTPFIVRFAHEKLAERS